LITYQQEFLNSTLEDARELLESHWSELALNRDKIKLNPDWETYEVLESQGKLKIFTARDSGVLVGYFVVVVSSHVHYKDHLFAHNDILYIGKEYRKGFTGIKLIKFAEKCLKSDGVSVLVLNTKMHKPLNKILEFLKFTPTETVYSKYIGN